MVLRDQSTSEYVPSVFGLAKASILWRLGDVATTLDDAGDAGIVTDEDAAAR